MTFKKTTTRNYTININKTNKNRIVLPEKKINMNTQNNDWLNKSSVNRLQIQIGNKKCYGSNKLSKMIYKSMNNQVWLVKILQILKKK